MSGYVGLSDLASPGTFRTITPSDDDLLGYVTDALNVSVTGPVHVLDEHGNEATLFVGAGFPFSAKVTKIFAAGTNAGTIVTMR